MTDNIRYEVTLYGFIEKVCDTIEDAVNEACTLRTKMKIFCDNDVKIIKKVLTK
jgi:hypothetical protein